MAIQLSDLPRLYKFWYDSGGYHECILRIESGLWCDGVVRSGNTVTVKAPRLGQYHRVIDFVNGMFGWVSTWWVFYAIKDGDNIVARTGTYASGKAYKEWWGGDPWVETIRDGDMYFNDFSFTVSGNGAGSKTLSLGGGGNTGNNTWDFGDGPLWVNFTVNYPANTKFLNINVNKVVNGARTEVTDGTIGKFDEYVPSGTKIGTQVSDQVGWDYIVGSTYKINNITEQSADWYYTGNSQITGTLNSDTTIELDFAQTTVPIGLDANLVSRSWNQVIANASCSDYGAPASRTNRYIEVGVAASTATAYTNRYAFQTTANSLTTGNKTFTHANLIGCAAFKLGAYASNTKKTASVLESTVYYLPPAPMASISLDGYTRNDEDVTFSVNTAGKPADGTNNVVGAKVNLEYRYSTDNGATYSNWTSAATNYDPSTVQTFSFNAPYNKAIKVQTRQTTYQDSTQASTPITLDIAEVHPYPKDPTINFSWDELDRTLTCVTVNNGSGGASGDADFVKFEFQMSYDSDFSTTFVNTNPTTAPYTYTISYLKPLQKVYIRARTTNSWDYTSEWTVVSPTVPRPLWGLVKGKSEITGNVETIEVRDMVKVKTNDTVSTRDWIEGTNHGKTRITQV